jgi:hypothetical protein
MPTRPPRDQQADKRVRAKVNKLTSSARHGATRAYGARLEDLLLLIQAHRSLTGGGQGGYKQAHALNRAALVLLCGHFHGFVLDLFQETWEIRYPGSFGAWLVRGFHNPWPAQVDAIFGYVGHPRLMAWVEARPTMLPAPNVRAPTAVRNGRTKYTVRAVIEEMIVVRNESAHGGRLGLRLRDVTNYLEDTVLLALAMDAAV